MPEDLMTSRRRDSGRTPLVRALPLLLVSLCGLGCRDKRGLVEANDGSVWVLRVKSPADDRAGAEHCVDQGASCRPLAPGQKLEPRGVVRTFAGGEVSLDLGQGRRIDLGSLSETRLGAREVALLGGDFGVETNSLIAKEPKQMTQNGLLSLKLGARTLSMGSVSPSRATLAVRREEARVTLRQGSLRGDRGLSMRQGQSVLLTRAGAFHQTPEGREVGPLPALGLRLKEYEGLYTPRDPPGPRGLGTMTARLPNTEQVRDGVRLLRHQVRVTIRDGFARTEVEEEFLNESPHVLEGRYRFPVPGDARLSRLALWVDERLMEGEVVERKRAREIYSSIVDRPVPRDPALLEWMTAGEMSLRVFPILPKKSRRVLLSYDQALSLEAGELRYVYPFSLGQGRENTIAELEIEVRLRDDTGGDLSQLRVPSHPAELGENAGWLTARFHARNWTPRADFVVLARRVAPSHAELSVDLPAPGLPSVPSALGTSASAPASRPGSPASPGHFVLRVSADLPPGLPRPAAQPIDRAIVLDVSHSQTTETIAAQAALLRALVAETPGEERFALLACDTACSVLSSASFPVHERSQRVEEFLSGLRPGGASDLAGALLAARVLVSELPGGHARQIVLLSDGQATAGELSPGAMAEAVRAHGAGGPVEVRLVGVGRTVDRGRLENLAAELDATFDALSGAGPLAERLGAIAMGLRQPVVRGARIQLPPGLRPARNLRIPALRLGQEYLVTGEVLGAAAGEVLLTGHLGEQDYRLARSLQSPAPSLARNPLAAGLWARDRILSLEAMPATPETTREILSVSTRFRTMSRLTSFLVLESDEMYQSFGVVRTSEEELRGADSGFQHHDQPRSLIPVPSIETDDDVGPGAADRPSSVAPAAASRAQGRARANSRPAPAARAPAKSRPSGSGAMSDWELGAEGASSPRRAPEAKAGSPADRLDGGSSMGSEKRLEQGFGDVAGPDPFGLSRRRRPHVPRAHLTHTSSDDAWRTWGQEVLDQLRQSLDAQPESRARMEAFVRGHLKQGRFDDAFRVASRFFDLDPDNVVAQGLLADAAVVSGNHELSRRMLDVRVETYPDNVSFHEDAARAFDAAGDHVRACAHRRSLADLLPTEPRRKRAALGCFQQLLAEGPSTPGEASEPAGGQLEVEVVCDAMTHPVDCPSPLVVTPVGQVISPWTPGTASSSRHRVSLARLRSGDYFVLVVGGAPAASGRVRLSGRTESRSLAFSGGSLHTVAKTSVRFY